MLETLHARNSLLGLSSRFPQVWSRSTCHGRVLRLDVGSPQSSPDGIGKTEEDAGEGDHLKKSGNRAKSMVVWSQQAAQQKDIAGPKKAKGENDLRSVCSDVVLDPRFLLRRRPFLELEVLQMTVSRCSRS